MYFNEEKMHKKPIKVVEICRVVFQEDGHVHNRQVAQAKQHGQNAPIAQEGREEQQAQEVVLRRSTRVSKALDCYVPSLDNVMLTNCEEPSCYDEAMFKDDKLKWETSMQSKMDLLHKNSTWELVNLSGGKMAFP